MADLEKRLVTAANTVQRLTADVAQRDAQLAAVKRACSEAQLRAVDLEAEADQLRVALAVVRDPDASTVVAGAGPSSQLTFPPRHVCRRRASPHWATWRWTARWRREWEP